MGGDSARTHSAFMYGYVACARDPEQNAMGNHPLLWSLRPEGNTNGKRRNDRKNHWLVDC